MWSFGDGVGSSKRGRGLGFKVGLTPPGFYFTDSLVSCSASFRSFTCIFHLISSIFTLLIRGCFVFYQSCEQVCCPLRLLP